MEKTYLDDHSSSLYSSCNNTSISAEVNDILDSNPYTLPESESKEDAENTGTMRAKKLRAYPGSQ